MNLAMTKQAMKFLESLDAKQYRQVVASILALLKNPLPHDSSALRGAKGGERRMDVGEYRVVYAIDNEIVSILVVGKRNDDDVYKKWLQSL